MEEERYLAPNRSAQIVFMVVLLVIVSLAAMRPSFDAMINQTIPSQGATSAELQAATRRLLLLGIAVSGFNLVCWLAWVIYFTRLGYRALTLGSYPPPGTLVVRRTRIRTGKQASVFGWFSIATAAAGVAFAALSGYAIWLSVRFL